MIYQARNILYYTGILQTLGCWLGDCGCGPGPPLGSFYMDFAPPKTACCNMLKMTFYNSASALLPSTAPHMSRPQSSFISGLWSRYKSLKLPWRRSWLAGRDLNGQAYYFYRPSLSSPVRRMLRHDNKTAYSDLQIPPQWYQWLHYTRATPPSLQELQMDSLRQEQLKVLARQADERWESKPKVMEGPRKRPSFALGAGDGEIAGQGEGKNADQLDKKAQEVKAKNPWRKRTSQNPGQGYQPEAWTPGSGRR